MLFGKWFGAAPTFSVPRATIPRVLMPTGPTMPGPRVPTVQMHAFPTAMPATNTGVFTTGALPYCDQVGCSNDTSLNCYGAGDTGTCGCPQSDGSILRCQRRTSAFPSCAQICVGLVACDASGCHCQAADGSTVMCARSIFNTQPQGGPYVPPDDGSTWHDGTTDQNFDSSSGAPNDGSANTTSSGSNVVCEAGKYYSSAFNMCMPRGGAPDIIPPAGLDPDTSTTTTTTTVTDPSTGQVSTTQVVTPTPIPTLPGIPSAPLFYQTPAFKVGMIALGVSALGVAAILVHRSRSA